MKFRKLSAVSKKAGKFWPVFFVACYNLYMKVLQVIGNKNVGKTSVILDFISVAKKMNLKVICLKRSHSAVLDTPETDSFRFACAGADAVGLQTEGEFLWHEQNQESISDIIAKHAPSDTDLILIEGFRDENFWCDKIELIGPNSTERIFEKPCLRLLGENEKSAKVYVEAVATVFPEMVSDDTMDFCSRDKRIEKFKELISRQDDEN